MKRGGVLVEDADSESGEEENVAAPKFVTVSADALSEAENEDEGANEEEEKEGNEEKEDNEVVGDAKEVVVDGKEVSGGEKEIKRRRRAKEGQDDLLEIKTAMIKGEQLQWMDTSLGGGPKVVKRGSKIRIRYTGFFAENNKMFDTTGRKCISFTAGKGEVIRGLDFGVKGMKAGGKRKIFIPSELAYGKEGAPPDIPPDTALVFEVEMVGFGKPKKKARNQKRQSSPPKIL